MHFPCRVLLAVKRPNARWVALAMTLAAGLAVLAILRRPPHRPASSGINATPASDDCLQDPHAAKQSGLGFTDVSDAVGLDFQHVVGPLGTYFMPESIGAGGALFDCDGDGRLDIYLVNCGRSPSAAGDFPPGTRTENRLFRQTPRGTFEDVTAASGLGDTGYGAGCAVGDVDNDGHPDVYVTNYGPDRLYRNQGDGKFVDVTGLSGIDAPQWGTSAAFFDYDRDGWLDLVVVNYTADSRYGHSVACGYEKGLVSYCGPHKFQPTIDQLFHNDGLQETERGGRFVRFSDVTKKSGFDQATTFGFGVACADLTADGWPDVFIANDGDLNRLWVNQHDGTFRDEAVLRGVAANGVGKPEAGMGVAVGDVDGDGPSDLLVTHLTTETSILYLNRGQAGFVDSTIRYDLDLPTRRRTGWGTALLDLDHDGWLDLPIANGLVVPCHSGFPFHGEDQFQVRQDAISDAAAYWRAYNDRNLLLMSDGGVRFRNAAALGGDFCRASGSGRSLIHGDFDDDGDVDLLATYCGGKARLYRNDLPKRGHWLLLRAFDPKLNRDAYGAEITIRTRDRSFTRLASPFHSYLASNDARVHVGLGDAATYEEITVRWPDGDPATSTEIFPGGRADRRRTLRRGEGRAVGH